jgi:hypothetical protein
MGRLMYATTKSETSHWPLMKTDAPLKRTITMLPASVCVSGWRNGRKGEVTLRTAKRPVRGEGLETIPVHEFRTVNALRFEAVVEADVRQADDAYRCVSTQSIERRVEQCAPQVQNPNMETRLLNQLSTVEAPCETAM